MVKRSLVLLTICLMSLTMGCTTVQKWMAGGAAVGATVGGIWGADDGGILDAGEGAAVGAVGGAATGALVGDLMTEDDEERATIAKYMAGGAVLGGVIGGVWGAQAETALNAGEGAAIGAATGATVGALAGDYAAQYNKLKALEAENADLKAKLADCERQLADAKKRIADLEAELDRLRKQGPARIEMSFLSDVLFAPGSAHLTTEGKAELDKAASRLKSEYSGKFYMIEGHTDSDPIKITKNMWKDNWDLGCGRSMAVLRYLMSQGIQPEKLAASTFSYYHPVAPNTDKAGKRQNRRAVIVVLNEAPTITAQKPAAK